MIIAEVLNVVKALERTFGETRGYYMCDNCREIAPRHKSFDEKLQSHCGFCGVKLQYIKLEEQD